DHDRGLRRPRHRLRRPAHRRAHRRRGHLRHRRRLPPAARAAGAHVPAPRRARRPGRHVADAPLPGCALGQRPVHLRLRLQAVARTLDRHRRRDPRLPRRGHRGERPGAAHPLPAPGHRREL
ncbi:MAG: Flavin-binding family monooxygenase, partial [uncultured Pseudonocardia sp.]